MNVMKLGGGEMGITKAQAMRAYQEATAPAGKAYQEALK